MTMSFRHSPSLPGGKHLVLDFESKVLAVRPNVRYLHLNKSPWILMQTMLMIISAASEDKRYIISLWMSEIG